jgi:hypothetical protein
MNVIESLCHVTCSLLVLIRMTGFSASLQVDVSREINEATVYHHQEWL